MDTNGELIYGFSVTYFSTNTGECGKEIEREAGIFFSILP
jgi:hypothetical protein